VQDVLKKLDRAYFWDVDFDKLDVKASKRLIVERVVNFGNLSDFDIITKFWGIDEIKRTVVELNYLDPKTLNFLSLLYNIPKRNFKCYTRRQLNPQHWNY
jgi:hypothetical protein